MKNKSQKIKLSKIAVLLIVAHLPLMAFMPIRAGVHFLEHRTHENHALAHTLLSCRLACTAFVFMPSPMTEVSQGLRPLFEEQSKPYENTYKKMPLSKPSIRGPPEEHKILNLYI